MTTQRRNVLPCRSSLLTRLSRPATRDCQKWSKLTRKDLTSRFLRALPIGAYVNSVAEVVSFMSKAGYNLMDITELIRSPKYGVLWLCELAFLRVGSPLWAAAPSF